MLFSLKGRVTYDVGSCHDSLEVKIERGIVAKNEKEAVAEARVFLMECHGKYHHLTDYGLSAELHVLRPKTKQRKIWEIRWQDEREYVPPQPAIPARKAGFVSKCFK